MPQAVPTLKETKPERRHPAGLLLVFVDGVAVRVPVPLSEAPRELGREAFEQLGVADGHCSRRHVQVSLRDGGLHVVDLGSTNGTFVDGARLEGARDVPLARHPVLRIGRSVLLGVPALEDDTVFTKLEKQLEVLRVLSRSVCVVGEPGSGRATLAREWLANASARELSCEGDAARLASALFEGSGALREGEVLLEALDALPRELQRALGRALAHKPVPRIAVTAREPLSPARLDPALVEALGRPFVQVPPLRERRDEVPVLVTSRLARLGLTPGVSLIEACLLRAWPGNMRALENELATAAARAKAEGLEVVEAELLPPEANAEVEAASAEATVATWTDAHLQLAADHLGIARKTAVKVLPPARLAALVQHPDATALLRAAAAEALLHLLERHDFQQAAVAQALEVSRTTLLKLMEHFELPRAAALTDAQVLDALAAHGQDVRAAAKALHVSVEALRQRLAQPRR